ncbi:MAG: dehydrogenase of unknown specificity, short-chain alcohol dehydrogenase like protein [Promethearchaeota archaeon CR_4]|nr:MAG: dehydrogenase of unknown specificity, short-chain alcohol dehydrogenase like protein [Candidatus Lokiarchaeota archaeon CR_4]
MSEHAFLSNKKIIITGASAGIGKTLAMGLANFGANVGLLSRSADRLSELAQEIKNKGGQAAFATGDMQKSVQVHQAINKLVQKLGGIDVLINNAGIMDLNPLPDNYDEIDRTIDTDLKGPLYCTLAVMPYFSKQHSGAIINTSSLLSLEAAANFVQYSVLYTIAKAGLNIFTRTITQRMNKDGVQVNAILPGYVKTELIHDVPQKDIDTFGAIQPEELLPFFAFFAANEDSKITGRLIPVDLFKSAAHFARKQFPGRVPTWEELEPHLKSRYSDPKFAVYGEPLRLFSEGRKVLLWLLGWNQPLMK